MMVRREDERYQNQGLSEDVSIRRMCWNILRNQIVMVRALAKLTGLSEAQLKMETQNMFDVQKLVDAAKRQTDATKAMKDAMDKMVAELRDAQDDPDQLEGVLTAMEANTATIAAAATSGTPADSGQPVPPVTDTGGSTGGTGGSTGGTGGSTGGTGGSTGGA